MKLSALIHHLQEAQAFFGDEEVAVWYRPNEVPQQRDMIRKVKIVGGKKPHVVLCENREA